MPESEPGAFFVFGLGERLAATALLEGAATARSFIALARSSWSLVIDADFFFEVLPLAF